MIAKKKSHKGYYPAAGHDRKLPDTAKNPRFFALPGGKCFGRAVCYFGYENRGFYFGERF